MSALSYKPLRKPAHLLDVTGEEINWKIADRKNAGAYFRKLTKKKYNSTFHSRETGKTKILSDAKGRIKNILLTIPPHYDPKNPGLSVDPKDARHFKSLIRHLSKQKRKYTILCHAGQIETVRRWFRTCDVAKKDYSILLSVFNYSIWAQDAYIALQDKKGDTFLAESICFTRDHDMSVADDVSVQSDIKRLQSFLYFQGGNVLQAGEYGLVGMDYILENMGRVFMESNKKVLKAFERMLGWPVIAVGRKEVIPHKHRQYLGGGLFQPVFHIDMYITPTGQKGEKNREIVFVGSPALARQILGEKRHENDFDIYFDEAAQQLSAYFDVKRLPLLPCRYRSKKMEQPRHYYLTYNNALVESYIENDKVFRQVYMPTYERSVKEFRNDSYLEQYYGDVKRYRKLDAAAEKIWKSIGFRVFKISGVEDLAMSWGAVHCIVKVIGRTLS
jgi:hypothetical protein